MILYLAFIVSLSHCGHVSRPQAPGIIPPYAKSSSPIPLRMPPHGFDRSGKRAFAPRDRQRHRRVRCDRETKRRGMAPRSVGIQPRRAYAARTLQRQIAGDGPRPRGLHSNRRAVRWPDNDCVRRAIVRGRRERFGAAHRRLPRRRRRAGVRRAALRIDDRGTGFRRKPFRVRFAAVSAAPIRPSHRSGRRRSGAALSSGSADSVGAVSGSLARRMAHLGRSVLAGLGIGLGHGRRHRQPAHLRLERAVDALVRRLEGR
ncbi:MAG: hypothetical protein BWZ10_01316 [candidate division BRC1 bacterium ADurb.BinA364]|nr:MAG: hypothetical protein BWZ10_01316 [candidate division BRC1 bacterium ADurb.BinA364]